MKIYRILVVKSLTAFVTYSTYLVFFHRQNSMFVKNKGNFESYVLTKNRNNNNKKVFLSGHFEFTDIFSAASYRVSPRDAFKTILKSSYLLLFSLFSQSKDNIYYATAITINGEGCKA